MTARDCRVAAMLVAGVLLFAFGASRLITPQANAVVEAMEHSRQQMTAVDR